MKHLLWLATFQDMEGEELEEVLCHLGAVCGRGRRLRHVGFVAASVCYLFRSLVLAWRTWHPALSQRRLFYSWQVMCDGAWVLPQAWRYY